MKPDSHSPTPTDWRMDCAANQIRFRSRAGRRLDDMSALQRGLLLAEVVWGGSLRDSEVAQAAAMVGLSTQGSFSGTATQASWFESPTDAMIVVAGCSGSDLRRFLLHDHALIISETVGRVHRGLKAEADQLWGTLESRLEANRKPIWFAGHSLGGAIAQILAARCLLSYIQSEPVELHTFGGPRLGDRNYVEYPRLRHYRWKLEGDVVPELPSVISGYRHSGMKIRLNDQGLAARPGLSKRLWIQLRELAAFGRNRTFDLSRNSIGQYVDSLFEAVRHEEQAAGPLV